MPENTMTTTHEEDFIHIISGALTAPATAKGGAHKMSKTERAEYLAMLNGDNPTPLDSDKANRILDALWHIMTAFVDLGFGIGPVAASNAAAPCGQVGSKALVKCDKGGGDALHSSHQQKTILNDRDRAAADGIAKSTKGAHGMEGK